MPSIAQLLPLLGEDYERKCIELGIIRRAREIKTPADLMMLCLFHLLNGVSLIAVSTVHDIAGSFAGLKSGESSEAAVYVVLPDKSRIPVRICVKRKDKEGCEESRKGNSLREETVLFNEYIVVVTSLANSVTPDEVLETYRWRWQVEIHFKRLKSILDFGDLPKKDPAASEAWLNGKIMVALLIEAFIAKASFSPCNRIE